MIFISDSKAFVFLSSLPESFEIESLFLYNYPVSDFGFQVSDFGFRFRVSSFGFQAGVVFHLGTQPQLLRLPGFGFHISSFGYRASDCEHRSWVSISGRF